MDYLYFDVKVRPAPSGKATQRQVTDFKRMSNESLKFTLDLLYQHDSPYLPAALAEVAERIERGAWLDIESHPPCNHDDVPAWLKVWPFKLLWSQRPR